MAEQFENTLKFLKAIHQLASPEGATIKGLMQNLGISRRSVFRLLESLEELGLPVFDEKTGSGIEKTYRLLDSYVRRLPNLTVPELSLTQKERETLKSIIEFCRVVQNEDAAACIREIGKKLNILLFL